MIAKELALMVWQEESMEDQFSNQEKRWEAQIVKLVHAFA
jgi:hypothetical protein